MSCETFFSFLISSFTFSIGDLAVHDWYNLLLRKTHINLHIKETKWSTPSLTALLVITNFHFYWSTTASNSTSTVLLLSINYIKRVNGSSYSTLWFIQLFFSLTSQNFEFRCERKIFNMRNDISTIFLQYFNGKF